MTQNSTHTEIEDSYNPYWIFDFSVIIKKTLGKEFASQWLIFEGGYINDLNVDNFVLFKDSLFPLVETNASTLDFTPKKETWTALNCLKL